MVTIAFIVLLAPSGAGGAVGGIIDVDTVWTAADSPIVVDGNIRVVPGVILEIEPGVTVLFRPVPVSPAGYFIRVDGTLRAAGTADAPILFTAEDNRSPWGGIIFNRTSTDWDPTAETGSILQHCVIEYAGNQQDAAVVISAASPRIADVIVRYSASDGIRASGENITITDTLIYGSDRGLILSVAGATLTGNYLIDNRQGIYIAPSIDTITLSDNTIISTQGTLEGAALGFNLHFNPPPELSAAADRAAQAAAEARAEAEANPTEHNIERAEALALEAEAAAQAVQTADPYPVTLTGSGNRFVNRHPDGNAIAVIKNTERVNGTLDLTGCEIDNDGGNLAVLVLGWAAGDDLPNLAITDSWWGTNDMEAINRMIFDGANDYNQPLVTVSPVSDQPLTGIGSALAYPPADELGTGRAGIITEDRHWTIDDSPVEITGNLWVRQGATLTIDPGVLVRFAPVPVQPAGYSLRIDGTLRAVGTPEAPITFTAVDPRVPWGAIRFGDPATDYDPASGTGSIIQHCIIEHAGNQQDAAIVCGGAAPLIADSIIRDSASAGIYLSGTGGEIRNNRIYRCDLGIYLAGRDLTVEGNYLADNRQGLVIAGAGGSLTISGNTVTGAGAEAAGVCLRADLAYRGGDPTTLTLTENRFESTDPAGVPIVLAAADPDANAEVTAEGNNFLSSGLTLLLTGWADGFPPPFSMPNNWWGASGPAIGERIIDGTDDYSLPVVETDPPAAAPVETAGSDLTYPPPDEAPADRPGLITEDRHWTLDDSPVEVTGNLWVRQGATLTIDPGVLVRFAPVAVQPAGYTLRIDGTLRAVGTPEAPITFTAADIRAPWGGIRFTDPSADYDPDSGTGSIIQHCIIEHAGNQQDAAIVRRDSAPLIADSIIRDSASAGIYMSGTGGEIRDNWIYRCDVGISLAGRDLTVEGNYLADNRQGLYIAGAGGNLTISGNTVTGLGDETAGGCLRADVTYRGADPTTLTLTGNRFENTNPAGAAIVLAAADPEANAVVSAEGNNFLSDGLTLLLTGWAGGFPAPFSMPNNWWGASGPAIGERIIDGTDDYSLPVVETDPPAAAPVETAGSDLTYPPPDEAPADRPGIIRTDTEWSAGSGPRRIDGDIVVAEGATLTLGAGLTVEFAEPPAGAPGYEIAVAGTLRVEGTPEAPVRLTPANEGGHWGGIRFESTSPAYDPMTGEGSLLRSGLVEGVTPRTEGGAAVDCGTAAPLISGSLIRYNAGIGVRSAGGAARIVDCRLHDNDIGIYARSGGGEISGSYLLRNRVGIRIDGAGGRLEIRENTVRADAEGVSESAVVVVTAYHPEPAEISLTDNRLVASTTGAACLRIVAADPTANDRVTAHNNAFQTGEAANALVLSGWAGDGPDSLDMTGNWWGTADPTAIDQLIYDGRNDPDQPLVSVLPPAAAEPAEIGARVPYPPIADAGPDSAAASDQPVTLDGSATFDPDGLAIYAWDRIDGPAVSLTGADTASAQFIAPAVPEPETPLTFALTVRVGDGFADTDQVTVAVSAVREPIVRDSGECFISKAGPGVGGGWGRLLVVGGLLLMGLGSWTRLRGETKMRHRRLTTPTAWLIGLGLVLCLAPGPAAGGYLSVAGGAGGEAGRANVTLETGAIEVGFGSRNLLLGLGMPVIFHGYDNIPPETAESPCPHGNCERLGIREDGTEIGLFGKVGLESFAHGLYLNLLGGFTRVTEIEVSRSRATGWTYEESSEKETYPVYGAGISYFIDTIDWEVGIHLDVDNRRGVTAGIGWFW